MIDLALWLRSGEKDSRANGNGMGMGSIVIRVNILKQSKEETGKPSLDEKKTNHSKIEGYVIQE